MGSIKNPVLFYGAIMVAIVSLLLCAYYLIPNIYHVPIPDTADPTMVHYKYVALFGSLTIMGVVGALIAGLKKADEE